MQRFKRTALVSLHLSSPTTDLMACVPCPTFATYGHSKPVPITNPSDSAASHQKTSNDNEDWEFLLTNVASPNSPYNAQGAQDISLAELAFWLGDTESGRLECSCGQCNNDVETSSEAPESIPSSPPLDLSIPPTFYAQLKPLIPVITPPRIDPQLCFCEGCWYCGGIQRREDKPILASESYPSF